MSWFLSLPVSHNYFFKNGNKTFESVYGEGNGNPLQYSCLENPMGGGAWWAAVHGVATSRTRLSDFTFIFHFHSLEKEMATHSSVLAWRIPRTGEPGGLPSMESHRVGHDWSDLAAAAACLKTSGEAKTLLSISPLTVTDLISQQDLEKHLFSVSCQIVSYLSIVFTDCGRRLAHIYGNNKLQQSHFLLWGTDYFRKKKKISLIS